ncbi:MAG: hypothetical protein LBG60_09430 [Bifidobacteriaceae bacterium]|nr:hypothetical protein [Bifidobacteriaceae bacterium]
MLLTALEDVAREAGWVVVSETARAGLVASLTETALPAILADSRRWRTAWSRPR